MVYVSMQNKTEFLFAHWAVPPLKNLRGAKWSALIERLSNLPADHPDALAFALLMVRLNVCVTCTAQRYRERGGCASCSEYVLTTLSKESEAALLMRYHAAQKEIADALAESFAQQKAA